MEEKTYSVKQRYKLYYIVSWIGVVIALVGYLMGGLLKQILPWIGFVLVMLAVFYRFTRVKCPHCGNRLTESKTIPDRCPQCHEELN